MFASSVSAAAASTAYFNSNLYWGVSNPEEVRHLQLFLKNIGIYDGPVTGNFLSLTQDAVKRFQISQNISPISGYFGPLSRAKSNAMIDTGPVSAASAPASVEVAPAAGTAALQAKVDSAYKQALDLSKSFKKWKDGNTSTSSSSSSGTAAASSAAATVPAPAIPVGAAGEIRLTAYLTGYTYWDNTPPGSADISHPIIHTKAGGAGTFDDPITVAVGHSIINGKDITDYPVGTKFYVPNLRKYFIAEDTCGDGNMPQNGPCHNLSTADKGAQAWLDLWIDGKNATKSAANACAEAITANYLVIQNPAANYAVVPGAVISGSGCPKQYGNTLTLEASL